MGAWIEMDNMTIRSLRVIVALFMGAWIEIEIIGQQGKKIEVALFMGAWIEIIVHCPSLSKNDSRSLHGSVD